MAENDFLAWLAARGKAHAQAMQDGTVRAGIGEDDCAWVIPSAASAGGRGLCITTDTLLEGTHFTADMSAREVGWKAMAVNLSDLAASGCEPRWGVVGLGLRRGVGETWARELSEGLFACAARYGLSLVGGDTTSGDGPTSMTVTVIGEPMAARPVLRSGAKAGDVLAVTGTLGGSILGRHLCPEPRFAEIRRILSVVGLDGVHACMDLSDGLSTDLPRMTTLAGCGAVVEEGRVPVSESARALAGKDGKSAFLHAVGDGEDFELLLAFPPEAFLLLEQYWTADAAGPHGLAPLTRIGTVEAAPGVRLRAVDGRERDLPQTGYEHELG